MPSIISLSDIPRSKFDKLKRSFKCSNTQLQEHIVQYAYSHQKIGLFQTYFYMDDEENYLGYISVAPATIQRDSIEDEIDIPNSIKYSIPALKVTRLCTFDGNCRQNVGSSLMLFSTILGVIQQKIIGCRAIIVDSKPEAVDFYKHLDFREINQTEDSDTIFMVNDILKPKELEESIKQMVLFCEVFNQKELIELLKS
jgi:hypothetical protein